MLTTGMLFFASCQKDDDQPLWLLLGGNDSGNTSTAIAVPAGVDPADITPVDNGDNNASSQTGSSTASENNTGDEGSSASSGGEGSGSSTGGSDVYMIIGNSQSTVNQVEQYMASHPDDDSSGNSGSSDENSDGSDDASAANGSGNGNNESGDTTASNSSGDGSSDQNNQAGNGDDSVQGSGDDEGGNLVRLGKDYCYSEGVWFRDAEAIFTYEGNKPSGFCFSGLPAGKYEVRVMARMWVKHGKPGSLPEGYENFEVMISGDGVFADLLIPASAKGLEKATGILDITDANPTIFVTWLNQQENVNFAIHQVKLKRVADSERSTLVGSIRHFSQKNFSVMMMILAAILVSLGVINYMKHRTA